MNGLNPHQKSGDGSLAYVMEVVGRRYIRIASPLMVHLLTIGSSVGVMIGTRGLVAGCCCASLTPLVHVDGGVDYVEGADNISYFDNLEDGG